MEEEHRAYPNILVGRESHASSALEEEEIADVEEELDEPAEDVENDFDNPEQSTGPDDSAGFDHPSHRNSQLINHPEYNFTLILRSEVIREDTSNFPDLIPSFQVSKKIRYIHRRLSPRRPERDATLDQFCTLYATTTSASSPLPDMLVLTRLIEPGTPLPYYHPSVCHLAFSCLLLDPPLLQIEVIPLPTDVNSRLFRTSVSLLETLHRYGWGVMTNYKKRVLRSTRSLPGSLAHHEAEA